MKQTHTHTTYADMESLSSPRQIIDAWLTHSTCDCTVWLLVLKWTLDWIESSLSWQV